MSVSFPRIKHIFDTNLPDICFTQNEVKEYTQVISNIVCMGGVVLYLTQIDLYCCDTSFGHSYKIEHEIM